MAQSLVTKTIGVVTQYNPMGTPSGAMSEAFDCVVRREGIVENRRGNKVYGSLSSAPSRVFAYANRVLVLDGATLKYDNGSGTFSSYSGSYSPVSGYKVRSMLANSNLYFTTDAGVKAVQDINGTVARDAGVPRPLHVELSLSSAGTPSLLANSTNVAYRAIFQRTDLNSNVLNSYPSARQWITNNSGATRDVSVKVYLPSAIAAGDAVLVYRTTIASGTTDSAGDTGYLCYTATVTSTDVSNKYVSFTDIVIDALLKNELYTNATQQGIVQGNSQPPLARDMALYKSAFAFYANTSTKHQLQLTLIGTGSLSGRTITIAGTTYTFDATKDASIGQVKVFSSGTAAQNIDDTARCLVEVINTYATNTTVYAYYISGTDETPGKVMIEERSIGGASFTVTSGDSTIQTMFFPQPPTSGSVQSNTSSTNREKNGLYYSKEGELEAVPLLNYFPVGPSNTELLRIAPLRDALVLIKEEGVYILTGDSPSNFNINPLDLTVQCKSVDSVVVLQNKVYMLSNQGVVAISDNGVEVISHDIEPEFLPLLTYSNLNTYTAAIAYESDRTLLISTIKNSTDTEATQTFVYNAFTRAWTKFNFFFQAGIVEPSTDSLYFATSGASYIYKERKDFALTDYADPETSITISAISGKYVTFSIAGVTPQAGWSISQGSTSIVCTAISASGSDFIATLLYNAPVSWTTGAASIYPSVNMSLWWNVWSGDNPGLLKQVRKVDLLTDPTSTFNATSSLTIRFKSDLDATEETQSIDSAAYGWGTQPWGTTPWGGKAETYSYPTWTPRNKQYCRLLRAGVTHSNAFERASIAGYVVTFEPINERVSR